MLILALDPATRCGVAEGVAGADPVLTTVNLGGRALDEAEDVFARAIAWIGRRLDAARYDAIAIETPIPKYDSSLVLGLYAIFAGAARMRGIPLHRASPLKWRAYALGTARLPRVKAKAAAIRTVAALGWEAEDDNAAEAGLIFLWCCSVVAPRVARRPEPLFLGRIK